jgi:hypothetical protein
MTAIELFPDDSYNRRPFGRAIRRVGPTERGESTTWWFWAAGRPAWCQPSPLGSSGTASP